MQINSKQLLSFIFAISALTIAGAWFFELVLKLEPCPLCLTQRLPYYAALLLSVAYLIIRHYEKAFFALLALTFAVSLYYGVFHAGAEWGFWQGIASCGKGNAPQLSAGDLLKGINDIKIIDCNKVQWRMFGLSLAGFNALISLFLISLSLYGFRLPARYPNRDNPSSSHAGN